MAGIKKEEPITCDKYLRTNKQTFKKKLSYPLKAKYN